MALFQSEVTSLMGTLLFIRRMEKEVLEPHLTLKSSMQSIILSFYSHLTMWVGHIAQTDGNGAGVFNVFWGKAMKNRNHNNLSHIPTHNDPVECGLIICVRLIICLPHLSL